MFILQSIRLGAGSGVDKKEHINITGVGIHLRQSMGQLKVERIWFRFIKFFGQQTETYTKHNLLRTARFTMQVVTAVEIRLVTFRLAMYYPTRNSRFGRASFLYDVGGKI